MTAGESLAVRALVHGRVQGVGFRAFVRDKATSRRLTGFARNLPDSTTVEVVAEGSREALEELLLAINHVSPPAQVSQIDVEWLSATGSYAGFRSL